MIINGDCLEKMREIQDRSIDCIITDPPYGLKFMNKKWDHGIPGIEIWKEALRICKPGSMMLAFGGTRTYHRLACAVEDAGWQIKDCIMWLYASGFPKSHNKFGLQGYGTALKPAYEPILMCMKPLDGTYAQNVEKWGLGGINIDASRIGNQSRINNPSANKDKEKWRMNNGDEAKQCVGRWPANVLFDEVAAAQLDEMSGIHKGGTFSKSGKRKLRCSPIYGEPNETRHSPDNYGDSGGASRFFYCAKSSSRERGEFNAHPTVKPLKLMEYLLKLVAPSGDPVALDPFMGSGSTLVAAKKLGIRAIGIEIDKEYCEIAQRRIL